MRSALKYYLALSMLFFACFFFHYLHIRLRTLSFFNGHCPTGCNTCNLLILITQNQNWFACAKISILSILCRPPATCPLITHEEKKCTCNFQALILTYFRLTWKKWMKWNSVVTLRFKNLFIIKVLISRYIWKNVF